MSKTSKLEIDPDNPIWTKRDFERALPVHGMNLFEAAQALCKARGKQFAPKKIAISIRLEPEIVAHLKKRWRRLAAAYGGGVDEGGGEVRGIFSGSRVHTLPLSGEGGASAPDEGCGFLTAVTRFRFFPIG